VAGAVRALEDFLSAPSREPLLTLDELNEPYAKLRGALSDLGEPG
jgi:hypothetical protein